MSTEQTGPSFEPYLSLIRNRLLAVFGPQRDSPQADPLDVMMLALVGSRTADDVAAAAYARLRIRYPRWADLAEARPAEVEALIDGVAQAETKALFLPQALRALRARAGDTSLDFLAGWPLDAAMAWLDGLPGVGPRVAAATLNFSRLRKRVLPVDPHLVRVGERLGLAPAGAGFGRTLESYMNIVPHDWEGADLYELHWLLKMLGQQVCTAGFARCSACPLTALCQHAGLRQPAHDVQAA